MKTLIKRLFRPKPKVDHLRVTVYTRKDCCCCHTAINFLNEAAQRLRFIINLVDIDADPDLVAAYGLSVPVVAINGKVRFRGVINPVMWNRLLAAEDTSKRSKS